MTPSVRAGSVLGLVLLTATPAPAAGQKEIDAAVQKGVVFLKGQYKGNQGVSTFSSHGIGQTALVGLALIEAKIPASDPVLRSIAATVRDAAYRETKTYSLALSLIFLDRLEDPADVPLIQLLAVRLLTGQTAQGGWTYDCIYNILPADEQRLRATLRTNQLATGQPAPAAQSSQPPAKPAWAGKLHPEVEKYYVAIWANRQVSTNDDNSNTQFGLIAVWAARKHGVPVESALDLVEKRYLATQEPSGSWSYSGSPGGGQMANSPSMACAGLLGLSTAIGRREERRLKAAAAAKEKEKPVNPSDPKSNDPFYNPPARADKTGGKKETKHPPDSRDQAVKAAMNYLGAALTAALQSGGLLTNGTRHGDRDLYFLWSVERVGVIFGVDKIGGVDWYASSADTLVRAQSQDGSWGMNSYSADINTAFALLVLTRANIASDLSSKVRGESGSNELRAGQGPGPNDTVRGPNQTGTSIGQAVPGLTPKPLPSPAEDAATRLAADLVKVGGLDWPKALEHARDAKGPDHTRAMVLAIHQLGGDRKKQAREALAERLTRMTSETLLGMVKGDDAELRRGAVLACAMKDDKSYVPHLIDRLTDNEEIVVRAAHAGLKSLTGQDFGPGAGATRDQRAAAATVWRAWWTSRK